MLFVSGFQLVFLGIQMEMSLEAAFYEIFNPFLGAAVYLSHLLIVDYILKQNLPKRTERWTGR